MGFVAEPEGIFSSKNGVFLAKMRTLQLFHGFYSFHWENRYFLLLFFSPGYNGVVDFPGSKSDHVVSLQKRKKKNKSQEKDGELVQSVLCNSECFHFMIHPFVSVSIDFFLHFLIPNRRLYILASLGKIIKLSMFNSL